MTSSRRRPHLLLLQGAGATSTVGYYYYRMVLVVATLLQTRRTSRFVGSCYGWRLAGGSSTSSLFREKRRSQQQRWLHRPWFAEDDEEQRTVVVPFPQEMKHADVHDYFMQLALEQAQQAARLGEVPIGALVVRKVTQASTAMKVVNTKTSIVSDSSTTATTVPQQQQQQQQEQYYEILAAQHNHVEDWHDASAHAELLALQQAGRVLRNWRLQPDATLYSTLEPCPMCLSSALQFRVAHVVYGAPDHRLGAIQTYAPLLQLLPPHPYHNLTSVTGGVRADECGTLLREFFQQRRKNRKPQCKDEEQEEEQGADR